MGSTSFACVVLFKLQFNGFALLRARAHVISTNLRRKSIAEMTPSREFIAHSLFLLECTHEEREIEVSFNNEITNSIRQKVAHATTDALVNLDSIGGC